MKYQVLRKCHGFLSKLWLPGIIESDDYVNWPADHQGIPEHFVPLKRVTKTEVVDAYEPMTMEQASNVPLSKQETALNHPVVIDDDEEDDDTDEVEKKVVKKKVKKMTRK